MHLGSNCINLKERYICTRSNFKQTDWRPYIWSKSYSHKKGKLLYKMGQDFLHTQYLSKLDI